MRQMDRQRSKQQWDAVISAGQQMLTHLNTRLPAINYMDEDRGAPTTEVWRQEDEQWDEMRSDQGNWQDHQVFKIHCHTLHTITLEAPGPCTTNAVEKWYKISPTEDEYGERSVLTKNNALLVRHNHRIKLEGRVRRSGDD